jgi:TonB family protein
MIKGKLRPGDKATIASLLVASGLIIGITSANAQIGSPASEYQANDTRMIAPNAIEGVCPNANDVRMSVAYPLEAQQKKIEGDVVVLFVLDPVGKMVNIRVVTSANPILDSVALNAVRKLRCIGQGEPVRVLVPFSFRLN